ncbi:MAG: 1-deoxy-D-xylulose-5-phosphate reductoisomerase [Bdellovibrionales bacterium]|nr:1-deoxy-D-xylulose-5-phosphate reductoisomerase [Bdellovibrionales bacterium]
MKKISILGSTGSIGQSTLSIVRDYPDQFNVVALCAGQNTDVLFEQIKEFTPEVVSVQTEEARNALLNKGVTVDILVGENGACEIAAHAKADAVVCAIVGSSGLRPTLRAIEHQKEVLLANKESMVVSGALMNQKIKEHQTVLRPIDSEHSAIFQSIQGTRHQDIRKIYLTASGGPFFLQPELDLQTVTKEQALKHPNWNMGPKITIDSATMMNKGLEVIEAKWLFDLQAAQIEIVIHPQSIIHSIVELIDGSSLCQMGVPHMRAPIAYALSYPNRLENVIEPVNFLELTKLDFSKPDPKRFPSITLAYAALESGPTYPAVLNGANEETVAAFLKDLIRFTDIALINDQVLQQYQETATSSIDDYLHADAWGRAKAKEVIEKKRK